MWRSVFARARASRSALTLGAGVGAGLTAFTVVRLNPAFCDAAPKAPGDDAKIARGQYSAPTASAGVLPEAIQSTIDSVKDAAYTNLVAPFTEPTSEKLLPDVPKRLRGKELPVLVLALDDLLVHSTWDRQYGWRYMKRPGVDEFLKTVAPYFEVVVWTEQFFMMEPVIVALDTHRVVRHRLYKDGMVYRGGRHVKDIKHLNRDPAKIVVVDCKRENASQQPENYIFVKPFTGFKDGEGGDDESTKEADRDLQRHIPFLLNLARLSYLHGVDMREEVARYEGQDIPTKFAEEFEALKKSGKRRAGVVQDPSASGPKQTIWEKIRASRASA